jgi:hypothetical protein
MMLNLRPDQTEYLRQTNGQASRLVRGLLDEYIQRQQQGGQQNEDSQ